LPKPIARRWPDATLVCVASGPTLTLGELLQIRGVFPVVAVNDAIRWIPWAEVLYSSDRPWWRFYGGVPDFRGQKVGVGWKIGDASPIPGADDVHVLTHTGTTGLETNPTGLRTGGHSGYAAINLAVHLGARQIVLLGYSGGKVGGQSHFFGRHPSGLTESSEANYALFRRAYDTLAPELTAAGVHVVNATRQTLIDAFPRADLAALVGVQGASC